MLKKLIYLGAFYSAASLAADLPKEALTAHNQLRALHHAPNLVWDDALAKYAKTHASQCRFQHSHGKYGENIAAGYPNIPAAIQAWYAENKNYSYRSPGFSAKTGHFTQVVWKSSQRLGCALVDCNGAHGTPGKFLVCEYSPAGNIVNEGWFAKNVLS